MCSNRIILLFVILASGIIASLQGGAASHELFYLSLLTPVVSGIYVFYVYLRFRLYQKIESKIIVKEEPIPYLFKLANEEWISFVRIQVSFIEGTSSVNQMEVQSQYALLPREEIDKKTTVCCHYRGEYAVGIHYVMVSDFFHLFTLKYNNPSPIVVKVLPRVLHLNHLDLAPDDEDSKQDVIRMAGKEEIPDIEVHEYQAGDSLRKIHWKASAREHKLLTKQYGTLPKTEIILLLDRTRPRGEELHNLIVEDKLIESALAVCDYFTRKETPISVFLDQGQMRQYSMHSRDDFDCFYQLCSELVFGGNIPLEKQLQSVMENTNAKKKCMVLTTELTDEFIRTVYYYTGLEHEMSILAVSDEDMTKAKEKLESHVHFSQVMLSQEVSQVLDCSKEKQVK